MVVFEVTFNLILKVYLVLENERGYKGEAINREAVLEGSTVTFYWLLFARFAPYLEEGGITADKVFNI